MEKEKTYEYKERGKNVSIDLSEREHKIFDRRREEFNLSFPGSFKTIIKDLNVHRSVE